MHPVRHSEDKKVATPEERPCQYSHMSNGMHDKPEKVTADLARVVRGDVFADILHRAAYSTDASVYRIVPACKMQIEHISDSVVVHPIKVLAECYVMV